MRPRRLRPGMAVLVVGFGRERCASGASHHERGALQDPDDHRHRSNPRISPARSAADFISDLQRKVGTDGKCDGPDEYRIWPNTKDREALGRIRQLLTAWDICQKEPAREECKQ